jgi:hypothetical protein
VAVYALGERTQAIGIGRCRSHLERLPILIEQVEVEASAAEIQTSVQH